MSVDKKAAMKRIIELTHSENWQEVADIGKQQQTLNFITTKFKKGSIRCVSWIGKQIGARKFIKIVSNL